MRSQAHGTLLPPSNPHTPPPTLLALRTATSASATTAPTAAACQVLEDDALALAAGLSSLVPPSLGDISSSLGGIRSNLQQLGSSKVGSLMQQVRAGCKRV